MRRLYRFVRVFWLLIRGCAVSDETEAKRADLRARIAEADDQGPVGGRWVHVWIPDPVVQALDEWRHEHSWRVQVVSRADAAAALLSRALRQYAADRLDRGR